MRIWRLLGPGTSWWDLARRVPGTRAAVTRGGAWLGGETSWAVSFFTGSVLAIEGGPEIGFEQCVDVFAPRLDWPGLIGMGQIAFFRPDRLNRNTVLVQKKVDARAVRCPDQHQNDGKRSTDWTEK
ncbi:hypothetical protein NL676_028835 [Syzygium grande]|nr:hypothetical protein NL676_028835 [Syzygium grande]